jgi:phosphoribosylglycinamide formyltransferase-1
VPLPRITVLISGRGSNLASLLEAEKAGSLRGIVHAVISNRADAAGLAIALAHGARINVVDHRAHGDRNGFEAALAKAVDTGRPDLVVLAGFMRILGPAFVARYANRMLNIHPSLLPAYPGLHTHRRALEDGVRIHGCTVHFVTADLDHGPIVGQAVVPVLPDDDETKLAARVLAAEHRLLPAAVRAFCDGRLSIDGCRVRVAGERTSASGVLFVPAV